MAQDIEEGRSAALSILNPGRWVLSLRRSARLLWRDLSLNYNRFNEPVTRSVPVIHGYCAERRFENLLLEYDLVMSDMYGRDISRMLQLQEGYSITMPPKGLWMCEPVDYKIGFSIAPEGMWASRKRCIHNETVQVITRQLTGLNPVSTCHNRKAIYSFGRHLVQPYWNWDFDPLPKEEQLDRYLNNKTETQKKMILGGRALVEEKGMPVDYTAYCFTKVEVCTDKPLDKREPRNISGNDPRGTYLGQVGPEYYDYQKQMTQALFSDEYALSETRFLYVGGMRGDRVGQLVTSMEAQGLWAIEVDLSRCDGHCSKEAREEERKYYRATGMSDTLLSHLKEDERSEGRTTLGIKFKSAATQGSGRPDTSLGTTIRLSFIWACYFAWRGSGYTAREFVYMLKEYVIDPGLHSELMEEARARLQASRQCVFGLGDDGVAGEEEEPDVEALKVFFSMAGHVPKIKIHSPAQYDHLSFCSSYFWRVGMERRVLGNMPFRTLSKTFISTDAALLDKQLPGYVAGIARGFKHYYWIPILGDVCSRIAASADERKISSYKARGSNNPYKIHLTEEIEVDPAEVHDHFHKLYGSTVAEVLEIIDKIDWTATGVVHNHPVLTEGCRSDGVVSDDPEQAIE